MSLHLLFFKSHHEQEGFFPSQAWSENPKYNHIELLVDNTYIVHQCNGQLRLFEQSEENTMKSIKKVRGLLDVAAMGFAVADSVKTYKSEKTRTQTMREEHKRKMDILDRQAEQRQRMHVRNMTKIRDDHKRSMDDQRAAHARRMRELERQAELQAIQFQEMMKPFSDDI